jgi:aryl-alcohol dehydrogenase-like predicted oxidoreductase
MLHREEMLSLWDKGLAKILHNFIASGRVKHIGVSVYSPDKAIQALNTEGIDMVQIPTNIMDRRFEKAGVFQLADKKKKKIYIRSVFLQGLILMDSREIPEGMAFAMPVLEKLESLSLDSGLTRHELALGYLKTTVPDAKVIFGADIPEHVKENCAYWEKTIPSSLISEVKKQFNNVDEKILNPALWPY